MTEHVKIDDTSPEVRYTVGATPQTVFTIPFTFFDASDIEVYVGGVRKTTDFTVAGTTGFDRGFPGGTVTFDTALTDTTVKLVRNVPIERTTDFPSSGPLQIPSINTQFDKLVAMIQQFDQTMRRAPLLDDGSSFSELTLPDPEAGKYLKWKADDSGLENSAEVTFAPNSYPVATQSEAEVGTLNTVLMTPLRSAQIIRSRNAIWTPKDFLAVGDGVTPDDDAFADIAGAMASGDVRHLQLTAGKSYLFSSSTRFDINAAPGNIIIEGAAGSELIFGAGTNARPFVIRNTDGVIVRGLKFRNENSAASTNCLDILNCSDALIEDSVFEGSTFYGMVVGQDVIGGTDAACDNVVIRFNTFKDIGCIGMEQFPKVKSTTTEVYGNKFFNCGGNPNGYVSTLCAFKPGQAYENAKVYGNIVYNVGDNANAIGMAIGNVESGEFYANEIYDARSFAIGLSLVDHAYPYSAEFRSVIIRDNVVSYRTGVTPTLESIVVNGNRTDIGEIQIINNTVIRPYRGIMVEPAGAIPKVSIVGNRIIEPVGSEPIYCSNVGGDAADHVRVENNIVINRDLTKTACRVYLIGCSNPTVRGNELVNFGNNAIILDSCTGDIVCDDNLIDGYNVANTSSVAAIGLIDSSASNTYYVRGNRVTKGQGNPKALISANSANPKIICHENKLDAGVLVGLTSTPNFQVDMTRCVTQFGNCRVFYGTAAPTTGAYGAGDRVHNTSPTAGGNEGWICAVGGSPGTWKTYGTIAS